jgi:Icc-related predicted phosphoesterase
VLFKSKKSDFTKIFFATDVHGSEVCFRKFLNGAKFYKADVLVLGGDLTGKMIVPIVADPNGVTKVTFLGQDFTLENQEEVASMEMKIKNSGFYVYHVSSDEYQSMMADEKKIHDTFLNVMKETLSKWTELAEEKLKDTNTMCYITGGNDDYQEVMDSFVETEHVKNLDNRIARIDESHDIIGLGWGSMTPWKCPRDISEEELGKKIDKLLTGIDNLKKAIFDFHTPPIDSTIDTAPRLDDSVYPPKPIIQGGQPVMFGAGSVAVRKSIEKSQPLLGLHGHIHESRGVINIGNTLCVNPGSEYSEGILRGIIVNVGDKSVVSHQFTSG